MRELRLRRLEVPIEMSLLRCVVDVVIAADDVSDLHIDVVDHHREIVSRRARRAHDHEIVEILVLETDRPTDQIVKLDIAIKRNLGANHVRSRLVDVLALSASAVVHGFESRSGRLLAHLVDVGLAAGTAVGAALGHQLFGAGAMHVEPFALIDEVFIPLEPIPLQALENIVGVFRVGALQIRVFDAEQELAPKPLGVEPIIESGSHAADVQGACRRRSETDPDLRLRSG